MRDLLIVGSWFSQVECDGLVDEVLFLTVKTGLAAEKIKGEFAREIRAAARAAGHEVIRVMVTRRRADGDG